MLVYQGFSILTYYHKMKPGFLLVQWIQGLWGQPGNLQNSLLAGICRLPSAKLNDIIFAMFPKVFESRPQIGN